MKKTFLYFAASSIALSITIPSQAEDVNTLSDWFAKGDTGLELRYRLETADQEGFDLNSTASTLLTRLNYKTADYKGFGAFLELTDVRVVGEETYNSTINGRVRRPVIADPASTELNQAYISYKNGGLTLKGGRQGINLDNQRFVGTVAFRQNDQIYDSVAAIYSPGNDLTAVYSYVWNVNRIFGDDHPLGNLDTNTHILNVTYSGLGFGKLTAYAYLLDLNDAPVFGLSSATYGARFVGNQAVSSSVKLAYELEYASQSDYKDNPNDFRVDYLHGSADLSAAGFTAGVGYELLGSDNGVGFSTPLATLHKFNGWADKFLTTPGAGLEDFHVSLAYRVPGEGPLSGLLLKALYHDFSSDVGNQSYGDEWNFLVSKKLNENFTLSAKAAFYNADTFATDTDRLWFTLTAKF